MISVNDDADTNFTDDIYYSDDDTNWVLFKSFFLFISIYFFSIIIYLHLFSFL